MIINNGLRILLSFFHLFQGVIMFKQSLGLKPCQNNITAALNCSCSKYRLWFASGCIRSAQRKIQQFLFGSRRKIGKTASCQLQQLPNKQERCANSGTTKIITAKKTSIPSFLSGKIAYSMFRVMPQLTSS